MRVFYSERHTAHAPKSMLIRGRIGPCPETPERAEILLQAATESGHTILAPQDFGADPIRQIHDPKHYDFLENAWAMWPELPDHGEEIIANVHPGRNMNGEMIAELELPTVLIQEGGYVSDYLGANLAAVLYGFESKR